MARRELGQLSLADGLVAGIAGNERLDRLCGLVDWTELDRELAGVYASARGRPSYPPLCSAGLPKPLPAQDRGLMKRSYGYARVRYRSLVRNAVQLHLLCIALNMRRMLVLAR
jgi:IS5 family transposase